MRRRLSPGWERRIRGRSYGVQRQFQLCGGLEKKLQDTYLTITTPSTFPLPVPNLSSTLSGTFLFILLKCLAQECESMTGASVRFNAWSAVWSDTWERSIKMPSRFISGMSSLPRGLSPPQRSLTSPKIPAESANALLQLCVRVMYLTPSWWYILNTASCIGG